MDVFLDLVLGDAIVSLTGCDASYIYGKNSYGSHVRYDRYTKKLISFKDVLIPSAIILAKNISLSDLYSMQTGEQIVEETHMKGEKVFFQLFKDQKPSPKFNNRDHSFSACAKLPFLTISQKLTFLTP